MSEKKKTFSEITGEMNIPFEKNYYFDGSDRNVIPDIEVIGNEEFVCCIPNGVATKCDKWCGRDQCKPWEAKFDQYGNLLDECK